MIVDKCMLYWVFPICIYSSLIVDQACKDVRWESYIHNCKWQSPSPTITIHFICGACIDFKNEDYIRCIITASPYYWWYSCVHSCKSEWWAISADKGYTKQVCKHPRLPLQTMFTIQCINACYGWNTVLIGFRLSYL